MGITAKSGPEVNFGLAVKNSTDGITGIAGEYNTQRAPDVSDLGYSMMDPRAAYQYTPGEAVTGPTYAFYYGRALADFVPFTASTNAIVSNTASSGVTAFTLQTVSSARGTFATNPVAPETGATLSSVLTLDSSTYVNSYNAFGSDQTVRTWAPAWGTGRCLSIVTASYTDSPITVAGRDLYGYKVTETISISSNGSPTSSYGGISQKAYKYVTAVNNSSVPSSTGILVGTTDRFEFPLYVPYYGGDITVRVSSVAAIQNAPVSLSTGNAILPMASSATATSTTADVRGIYISSLASDGTMRVQIAVTPSASAVQALTPASLLPLFGATQFSSV